MIGLLHFYVGDDAGQRLGHVNANAMAPPVEVARGAFAQELDRTRLRHRQMRVGEMRQGEHAGEKSSACSRRRAPGTQGRGGNHAHLAADAGHDLDHEVELLLGVRGRHRAAQQRHAVGRGRRNGDVHVDAGIEQGAPEADRHHLVGQMDADDRTVFGSEREALGLEAFVERMDVVPEVRPQLGMGDHDLQRLADRGHDRGRQRGREHVGARGDPQHVEIGIVRDAVAADRAQRLGEGADDVMAVVQHALFFAQAAAMLAECAQRMGLVDQHVGFVFLADFDEFLERRRIAQHRVDAFQHHQPVARLVAEPAQAGVEARRIVVLEAHHLGLGLLAGVVDRGVAVGVDQQEVFGAHQVRDDPEIGLVAGREDHAVLLAVERGDLFLERHVLGVAAVGDARAGRAGALGTDRLDGGFHAGRVEGQAEVVIGADEQGLLAVDDRLGGRQHPLHADLEGVGAGRTDFAIELDQTGVAVQQSHDA